MITDSDSPTQEMSRPAIPPRGNRRFREIARDIREATLAVAAITWLAVGVVCLVGFGRLTWKLW